jgi:hypothetical protein
MAPWGYISFKLGCGGGSKNSVKRSKYDRRVLLRLTEFILPPPHPSVKEMYPRGAISYDQFKFASALIKHKEQKRTEVFLFTVTEVFLFNVESPPPWGQVRLTVRACIFDWY